MKLRLLLFEECNRSCDGCCNGDWDLSALEGETDFRPYSEILLTGGEPMLHPLHIAYVCGLIRAQTNAPIYLYTALAGWELAELLRYLDGICYTLHEQEDVGIFGMLNDHLLTTRPQKSLRLNVFRGVDVSRINLDLWKVKRDIEWIKNCPLPAGEVFKRGPAR